MDLMNLLSVLRNGHERFLPLLRAKVDDVLPRIVTPMLQTVPDTPMNMCADVDIFDGFGASGVGVASSFPGYNGDGTSGFKSEPESDFNRSSVQDMPQYEPKRIEEFGSPPTVDGSSDNINSPFTNPPGVMQSPIEYSGYNDYGSFPDMSSPAVMGPNGMPSFGDNRVNFKSEFDFPNSFALANQLQKPLLPGGGMESYRRPPLRQNSGSSFGMQMPPRSMPEQFRQMQSPPEEGMGIPGPNEIACR